VSGDGSAASCQRYAAKPRDDEDALVKRMLQFVRQRAAVRVIAGSPRYYAAKRGVRATHDLPTVASGGPESAAEEAKTPTTGEERERLSSASGRIPEPCLVLGLSCSIAQLPGATLKWLSIVDE